MNLTCPVCQNAIRADDINLQSMAAKCSACNNVFGFGDKLPRAGNKKFPEVMPKGIQVMQENLDYLLVRKWFSAGAFFLLFFAIIWDVALFSSFPSLFRKGPNLFFALVPLLHVAIGIAVTYLTLASFLNKTTVRVSPSSLDVTHGPVPWPGVKPISREQIDQFYCKEKVYRTKNGRTCSYQLYMATKDGRQIKIFSIVGTTLDEARAAEQALENHLGIHDRSMPNEY